MKSIRESRFESEWVRIRDIHKELCILWVTFFGIKFIYVAKNSKTGCLLSPNRFSKIS